MSPARCRALRDYYRGLALSAWVEGDDAYQTLRFLARFWTTRAIEAGQ